MINIIPVTASSWLPISGYYPYDENIKLRHSFIKWSDGYTAFEHNAFKNNVDFSTNKETVFYLSSSKTLFDFIEESNLNSISRGTYIILSIDAGYYFSPVKQFVTIKNDSLFLNALSTDESLFRFEVNSNGSFSLYQGNGNLVTVDKKIPFNLTLQAELNSDEIYRQQFYCYEKNEKIFITTKTLNPNFSNGFGDEYEERFWSFSKTGPEKGRLRACGLLRFNDYSETDQYSNDYLFNTDLFQLNFVPSGLISDHNWVHYYNELLQKENNKNTEIYNDKSVSGVYINHLFDLPYNTKINIDQKNMAINFANLKNVMTPEYRYRLK